MKERLVMAIEDDVEALQGRVRALEALILALPVSEAQIQAGKERIRGDIKRRNPQFATLQETLGGPLDEPAEKTLEDS